MLTSTLSRGTAAGLLAGFLFVGCGPSGNSNSPTGGTGATGSTAGSGAGTESAGPELKSDLLAPAELAKLSGKIQIDGSSSLFP
ncbi:MAG: hypothetical protein NT069_19990, partial [Planctomycetota bacterium]|nr:hypothetical protein [Planctomycetota bacterium]